MIKLPKHNCELSITHNRHKSNYEKVKDLIEFRDLDELDFVSKEEMELCIKNDELWEIQWYPHTPIGFYCIYGYTLESVIKEALRRDDEQTN